MHYLKRIWHFLIDKKLLQPLIGLIIIGAALLWGPSIYANLSTRSQRYDLHETSLNDIPKHRVGIVFGAGIDRETGAPTPYLQWRVETAVKLYKAGRIQKLLMSGDNSRKGYDEPTAMKKLAVKEGVKASDITLDYAGFNTYDSCYRAHFVFGLNDATLITQGYHLPRAVFACSGLGVQATGVDAVNHGRDWAFNYTVREWISTDKITWQLIFRPTPTALGPKVPIR